MTSTPSGTDQPTLVRSVAAATGRQAVARTRRSHRVRIAGLSALVPYAVLLGGAVLFCIPFFFMVSQSLMTDGQARQGGFDLPHAVQWENYPQAVDRLGARWAAWAFPALSNTVVITVLCIVGQVLSCSIAGFGFARYRFRGRDALFAVLLATMMVPVQVTMIPLFLLFRELGWVDTLLPLIVPAFFGTPFFIFMFRQFFMQVPEELLEAARLDGAGELRIWWQLMLPLSKPVIAIVAIYSFLGAWNDFLGPLIYLNSPENETLALALNRFNGQYGVESQNLLMAASLLTMLPCIVLFFAAQRYFVSGGATTGIK